MRIYRFANEYQQLIERLQRQIADELRRSGEYDIVLEPGGGATYSHGDPTIYFYGTYEDSSVLAGRSRRAFIDSFNTNEEAEAAVNAIRGAGIDITSQSISGFVEDEMLDLPDEDGNVDPNYISPADRSINNAIKNSEV